MRSSHLVFVTFTLRVLRSHGLPPHALHEVDSMITVASMIYASRLGGNTHLRGIGSGLINCSVGWGALVSSPSTRIQMLRYCLGLRMIAFLKLWSRTIPSYSVHTALRSGNITTTLALGPMVLNCQYIGRMVQFFLSRVLKCECILVLSHCFDKWTGYCKLNESSLIMA